MKKEHKLSQKSGLPPGSLVHIGEKKSEETQITLIDYSQEELSEKKCKSPSECFSYKEKNSITWINIDGLHDVEIIESIGKHFDLHPLLLEDILNTRQRPKVEEFDNYIFFTLKMLSVGEDQNSITAEQVSFVLGKNWILSFQERPGDVFDPLRSRIRNKKSQIRGKETDYLFYRLLDTVVDNYFFVTEFISDTTEKLEEKVIENPNQDALSEIRFFKKQLLLLKRAVSPLREAVAFLYRDPNNLIHESTTRYLRDVYDHIIQANESSDNQRDTLATIMDLYHSGISNKMNQVMQVLTIISTIFIPLTFIAGIYGMNFNYMPELQWKYGYYSVWAIMVLIIFALIFFFKRKKWI